MTGYLTVALVVFEIIGVCLAFRAVSTARTPQGSVGWVVFLISLPYIAVPAYLYLGHTRYAGFVTARPDSERAIEELGHLRKPYGVELESDQHREARRRLALEKLAEMPIVTGNGYHLLIDGEATFEAIFEAIDQAEKYLLVAFYILRDDELGCALKDRLIQRARDGLMVKVIYDAIGSTSLPKSYLRDLREAGVDIRDFHAIRRPAHSFQLNFRNHRKIVIADGRVGLVGGLNVGDEYMGKSAEFGPWRDTHVRLHGPVVAQLQLVFAEDWHWASGEVPHLNWHLHPVADGVPGLIMPTGPGDSVETASLYFCNIMGAARDRLWIASPYFVPDLDIMTALKLAAMRGVDVRILMPDMKDHLLVWLAAFSYFDEMRETGVKFFRYREGFMHQKV
ncbi:MAG: cardiolipin synthase, partial [Alphaproteobacteria bacterium]|nr:cardiolipin synthase [Alphaproteobacteria bacterium]